MILIAANRAIKTDDEFQVENVLEESYWYTGDKYVSIPSGGSQSIQIQFLAFALGSYTCQVNFINCFLWLNLHSFYFILFHFILFYFILRHSFCSIYPVNFYLISKIAFYYYSILSIFMWISFPSDKASLPTLNLLLHFYQFYLRITLLQSVEIKNNKLLISSFLSINIINRLY